MNSRTRTRKNNSFEPFTLELDIDTQEELEFFLGVFNNTLSDLLNIARNAKPSFLVSIDHTVNHESYGEYRELWYNLKKHHPKFKDKD